MACSPVAIATLYSTSLTLVPSVYYSTSTAPPPSPPGGGSAGSSSNPSGVGVQAASPISVRALVADHGLPTPRERRQQQQVVTMTTYVASQVVVPTATLYSTPDSCGSPAPDSSGPQVSSPPPASSSSVVVTDSTGRSVTIPATAASSSVSTRAVSTSTLMTEVSSMDASGHPTVFLLTVTATLSDVQTALVLPSGAYNDVPSSKSSGSSVNAGALAGGIAGGLIAVILLGLLVWWSNRRRRSSRVSRTLGEIFNDAVNGKGFHPSSRDDTDADEKTGWADTAPPTYFQGNADPTHHGNAGVGAHDGVGSPDEMYARQSGLFSVPAPQQETADSRVVPTGTLGRSQSFGAETAFSKHSADQQVAHGASGSHTPPAAAPRPRSLGSPVELLAPPPVSSPGSERWLNGSAVSSRTTSTHSLSPVGTPMSLAEPPLTNLDTIGHSPTASITMQSAPSSPRPAPLLRDSIPSSRPPSRTSSPPVSPPVGPTRSTSASGATASWGRTAAERKGIPRPLSPASPASGASSPTQQQRRRVSSGRVPAMRPQPQAQYAYWPGYSPDQAHHSPPFAPIQHPHSQRLPSPPPLDANGLPPSRYAHLDHPASAGTAPEQHVHAHAQGQAKATSPALATYHQQLQQQHELKGPRRPSSVLTPAAFTRSASASSSPGLVASPSAASPVPRPDMAQQQQQQRRTSMPTTSGTANTKMQRNDEEDDDDVEQRVAAKWRAGGPLRIANGLAETDADADTETDGHADADADQKAVA